MMKRGKYILHLGFSLMIVLCINSIDIIIIIAFIIFLPNECSRQTPLIDIIDEGFVLCSQTFQRLK